MLLSKFGKHSDHNYYTVLDTNKIIHCTHNQGCDLSTVVAYCHKYNSSVCYISFYLLVRTIIIYYLDCSMFNAHCCNCCGRPTKLNKVLDSQCQSSIFCFFQAYIIIYSLVVAYSVMTLRYCCVSYFIKSKFLSFIV